MEQLEQKTAEKKRRRPRARRDWLLPASAVAAIALIVIFIAPVIRSAYGITRYRTFIGDLANSIAYGADGGTLEMTVDGEEQTVANIRAEDLLIVISRAGQGRLNKKLPEDAGVLLTFGDGSTLQLCPTTMSGTGRSNDVFTHVHYTGKNGKVYAYDTEQLLFRTVLRTLGLPWQV